ncbi:MAG: SGNH/GDSL hydrolase family protein [Candidatus Korobacteraceae bacterium]
MDMESSRYNSPLDAAFIKQFGVTVALLLGLLILNWLPAAMGYSHARLVMEKVLKLAHEGGLNREDFDALAGGYYEGLERDASPAGMPEERDDIRFRDDFLRYELRPGVKRHYPAGLRFTNSLGMANPEYGYAKPPHTRRIALIGDSISLGPYGQDYEALLEKRLNQTGLTPDTQQFQILNFAVYGYNVLQMMDVMLNTAPKFHPDVYLVALTTLEANKNKASTAQQIARLKLDGVDLKYDYLKQIAAQAGVQPTDHLNVMMRKLAPFHTQVTRWALTTMRDHAAAEGAQMVVLLVPAPIDPEIVSEIFDEIRPVVDGLGVPVIDLRNTFRHRPLEKLQIEYGVDVHPNAAGHEIIFDNLYKQLQQNPKASASLMGTSADAEHRTESQLFAR